MSNIEIGIKGEKSIAVTMENTAIAMGSGSLRVFATPAMAALVEACCTESVEELLDEELTTVGTELEIDHISASPIGASILCKSVLIEIDGRELEFEAEIYDNAGLIGKAEHTRVIVDAQKFFEKAYAKLDK